MDNLIQIKFVVVQSLSHSQLFAVPWAVAHKSSLSRGFPRARILEWLAISYCRGSSHPWDQTCVSWLAGVFFTTEPPGKP